MRVLNGLGSREEGTQRMGQRRGRKGRGGEELKYRIERMFRMRLRKCVLLCEEAGDIHLHTHIHTYRYTYIHTYVHAYTNT